MAKEEFSLALLMESVQRYNRKYQSYSHTFLYGIQSKTFVPLTHFLLVPSAENICKQFGPRPGSKLFDTLIIFLKEFFENTDFGKIQQTTKKSGVPLTLFLLVSSAENIWKQFEPR